MDKEPSGHWRKVEWTQVMLNIQAEEFRIKALGRGCSKYVLRMLLAVYNRKLTMA